MYINEALMTCWFITMLTSIFIQIQWMRCETKARVLMYLDNTERLLRLGNLNWNEHRNIVRFQSVCDSLFSKSRRLKSYPYTCSPHVWRIRFIKVHYSINNPLESQFVVICVGKLHRHFNVCKFRLCITVYIQVRRHDDGSSGYTLIRRYVTISA